MGKKSSASAVSKISAAASPATPANPNARKSSILRSSFAPSSFQLRLFASVIQSFDSQLLRIHDTTNGRLQCQHSASPGSRITSLDWGYHPPLNQETQPKKKRKRSLNKAEHAVVAYGTDKSEVCMFSASEGKVVGVLADTHARGIRDFRFSKQDYQEGWSIGNDGQLAQWDLNRKQVIRKIDLPDASVNILTTRSQYAPQLICASATPYAINLVGDVDISINTFDSFKNPIHTVFRSGRDKNTDTEFFLAADKDRYINIYDIKHKRLVRTLVASSEVETADFSSSSDADAAISGQLLAVVTKDGIVELFAKPFEQPQNINGDLKSSRKNLTRKASASVKLTNPDNKSKPSPVVSASIQGPDLLVALVEGGVEVSFQKIRWQDEGNGELLFDGTKEVIRTRNASTFNNASANGVKDMSKSRVDESKVVVVNGDEESASHGPVIDISSSDEAEDDEDADEESEQDVTVQETALIPADEESDSDEEMAEAPEPQEDARKDDPAEDEEPSFGEMLASKQAGQISIIDAFQPSTTTLTSKQGNQLAPPSGMSLGTVLTQSLRTNDRILLESCLHTTDVDIVRNTIQRLDPSLAGILLSKLAERLASRPGRYGYLLTWVQWICVAHGGALASQAEVIKKLRSLYQVLDQRVQSMDNLLLLKGKLDMLDAQLTFRKQLQSQRETQRREDQDESGMIYIEGEADNWSSDEDSIGGAVGSASTRLKHKPRKEQRRSELDDLVGEKESSEDEDMPLANGISESDSDEDDEDEDGPVTEKHHGGIVDEEAEVSGASDLESDEDSSEGAEDDDVDSEDDEENEEEDSDMDSFINDGSISEVEDRDDLDIDRAEDSEEEEEIQEVKRPATKRSKHR